jgi:hypothetical protein
VDQREGRTLEALKDIPLVWQPPRFCGKRVMNQRHQMQPRRLPG